MDESHAEHTNSHLALLRTSGLTQWQQLFFCHYPVCVCALFCKSYIAYIPFLFCTAWSRFHIRTLSAYSGHHKHIIAIRMRGGESSSEQHQTNIQVDLLSIVNWLCLTLAAFYAKAISPNMCHFLERSIDTYYSEHFVFCKFCVIDIGKAYRIPIMHILGVFYALLFFFLFVST